jgi:hypothetical protein
MRSNPQESSKIAAEELRTTEPLALRMLGDVESYDMEDVDTAVNIPGLRRVFETLQKTGDIATSEKFDPFKFVDFSYWEASHPDADPVATGGIRKPAAKP